jgi:hypothetical protein
MIKKGNLITTYEGDKNENTSPPPPKKGKKKKEKKTKRGDHRKIFLLLQISEDLHKQPPR